MGERFEADKLRVREVSHHTRTRKLRSLSLATSRFVHQCWRLLRPLCECSGCVWEWGVNWDGDCYFAMISEGRPFTLALVKDVMVKCHRWASADDAMCGWSLFAVTFLGGLWLGISSLIWRPYWLVGGAGVYAVGAFCGSEPCGNWGILYGVWFSNPKTPPWKSWRGSCSLGMLPV